jgi:hypothetical protein
MGELSKTTASKVREKLETISARLKAMEIAKDAGARTNGIFHWNGRDGMQQGTNSVQLNKVTSVGLLIAILGFLMTRKTEYDQAAEKLDLNPFPAFLWSGYNLDAWEVDIKARINAITHHDEIEKLTKLKEELSKYVSEEDRVISLLEQMPD